MAGSQRCEFMNGWQPEMRIHEWLAARDGDSIKDG